MLLDPSCTPVYRKKPVYYLPRAFGSGKTSPVSSFQTIKPRWCEVEDKEKRTFKGEKILAIQQKQRSSKTNHARLYGFHV
jgi:hypothetical protein